MFIFLQPTLVKPLSKKLFPDELQNVLQLPKLQDLYSSEPQLQPAKHEVIYLKNNQKEPNSKTCFNYLLIDPRVTENLPLRFQTLDRNDSWHTFLDSIFYVGKGKRSRPFAHLHQATKHLTKPTTNMGKKVETILGIWGRNRGVVCLQCFHSSFPDEAYTREAAMIEALTLGNLTNVVSGEFYGTTEYWSEGQKRLFGAQLLYRAMQIFLHEGEREVRPEDLEKRKERNK